MLQNEIEINKLQKQLKEYKAKKKKAEKEMSELEDVIAKIRAKSHEIEEGLQETINNIERRLNRINQKSRFRARYLANARNIVLNSDSSMALQGTRDAERKAIKKYWALDDKISEYQSKIFALENQINRLKQQSM